MKKKNVYKVFSTSVVATMLSLSLGVGNGSAEENEVSLTEEIISQVGQTVVTEAVNGQATEQIVATATDETNQIDGSVEAATEAEVVANIEEVAEITASEQEAKELLPGELFYFFKVLTEKIKLALAFDDINKAKLLAQFTEDRLNEAEVLFNKGEEDLAYSSLLKAVELQEKALDYTSKNKTNVKDITQNEEVETDEQDNTESQAATDENSTEVATETEDVKEELEKAFASNVYGLLNAIENVKNPKALEALIKNLEKATEKFEKQYGILLESENKLSDKMEEIEAKVEAGQLSAEEADREKNKFEVELTKKQAKVQKEAQNDKKKIEIEVNVGTGNDDHDEDEDREEDDDKDHVDIEEILTSKDLKLEIKKKQEELKDEKKQQREEVKEEKKKEKEEKKQKREKEHDND